MINEQTVKLKVASTSVEYARWGEITGNIESQTDLMNLLGERDLDDVQEAITQGLDDIDTAKEEAIEEIGQRGGITEAVKQALLNCFSHVAWIDDQGQTYYDALEDALYPPASLVSISAVYTQSGTVYDTDTLDSLKSDLVVTALWDNQTTTTVTDYTLSGTLTEGTSTITVAYGGKTTTFDVTVSAVPTLASISAVYTQSGTVYTTDTLDSLKSDLVVTAHYSDSSAVTVPSADYTLSGTLTVGTSVITVTYGGMTTTFNVAVVRAEYGNDYTWLYKASDGTLLSARTDLVTPTISTGCTETLVDGLLHLFAPKDSSNYIRYALVQTTNENAKLTAKVKFGSVPNALAGAALRMQVSNGTNGAQILERYDRNNSLYKFGTFEGSSYTDKLSLELNRWYIISTERNNGSQIVTVDGTEILNSSTLSTNYCTSNAIFAQNVPVEAQNDLNVYIEWITYKNND